MKNVVKTFTIILLISTASYASDVTDAEAVLKKVFPKLTVDKVTATPIKGVFEIIAADNVFYFSPETEQLIFGEVYTKEGKNITAEKRDQLRSQKFSKLPLDKAIKIGNGKNVVIEFTDPDCPFCRKAFEFFKSRNDVTKYVFFNPLVGLHPGASEKARYILSAADKAKAYMEVFSGVLDGKPLNVSEASKNMLDEHMQLAASVGVKGTPTFWINGRYVSGADFQSIKKYLEGGVNAGNAVNSK